jgi:hypothetical protein
MINIVRTIPFTRKKNSSVNQFITRKKSVSSVSQFITRKKSVLKFVSKLNKKILRRTLKAK